MIMWDPSDMVALESTQVVEPLFFGEFGLEEETGEDLFDLIQPVLSEIFHLISRTYAVREIYHTTTGTQGDTDNETNTSISSSCTSFSDD